MSTKPINHMLNLVVIVALALSWLPVTTTTATSLPGMPAAQRLPVETLLNSDGTLNTRTGASGALDLRGWNVTLDSRRGPILTRDAPAALNMDMWSGLAHDGLNNYVFAIVMMGSDLYVGGEFTGTHDGSVTNLNCIAKYSGGKWSALANNGLNGIVFALAVSGSDLFVGGQFTQTADGTVTNLGNIARYSGGKWSALAHNGLDNRVYALAVMGSDLYVGGQFTNSTDGAVSNLNYIARYSSGGTWWPLANSGLQHIVMALAVMGSDLYVGGLFNSTHDGLVTNLNDIARYSGGAWYPLGNGFDFYVYALAVIGSDLYVGGNFDDTPGGATLNKIARYSGGAWYPLANNGLNSDVWALAVIGSDLYVGGYFTQTADGTVNLNYMAKYSGGTWSPLANNGLSGQGGVRALAASGSDLYAGGAFLQTADGTKTNLSFIAKFGAPPYSVYLPLVTS